jgi:hypothetical protein
MAPSEIKFSDGITDTERLEKRYRLNNTIVVKSIKYSFLKKLKGLYPELDLKSVSELTNLLEKLCLSLFVL